jgi:hypothetical protein
MDYDSSTTRGGDKGNGVTSQFKGVCWDKLRIKWVAQIKVDGKNTHLGSFDNEEEAASAHDVGAACLGWPMNFTISNDGSVDLNSGRGDTPLVKGVNSMRKDDSKNLGKKAAKTNISQRSHVGSRATSAVKGAHGGTSQFKGVSWHKSRSKWRAEISIDGTITHLGYFNDEEVAARAYDEAAARLGRPMNFPAKGVSWDEKNSKWRAEITINGTPTFLGDYDKEKAAASAYGEAATRLARRPVQMSTRGGCTSAVKGHFGCTSQFKGVCWDKKAKKVERADQD